MYRRFLWPWSEMQGWGEEGVHTNLLGTLAPSLLPCPEENRTQSAIKGDANRRGVADGRRSSNLPF